MNPFRAIYRPTVLASHSSPIALGAVNRQPRIHTPWARSDAVRTFPSEDLQRRCDCDSGCPVLGFSSTQPSSTVASGRQGGVGPCHRSPRPWLERCVPTVSSSSGFSPATACRPRPIRAILSAPPALLARLANLSTFAHRIYDHCARWLTHPDIPRLQHV